MSRIDDLNSILDENKGDIFIRLATKKEQKSETEKKKAMNSFPEKDGYEIGYKPYGSEGRGFYYVEPVEEAKKDLLGIAPSLEAIEKMISKFYMGSTITLKPVSDIEWEVHTGKGKVGTRVIKKGNRFRFEFAKQEEGKSDVQGMIDDLKAGQIVKVYHKDKDLLKAFKEEIKKQKINVNEHVMAMETQFTLIKSGQKGRRFDSSENENWIDKLNKLA